MNVDENVFFREATLRICSSLGSFVLFFLSGPEWSWRRSA